MAQQTDRAPIGRYRVPNYLEWLRSLNCDSLVQVAEFIRENRVTNPNASITCDCGAVLTAKTRFNVHFKNAHKKDFAQLAKSQNRYFGMSQRELRIKNSKKKSDETNNNDNNNNENSSCSSSNNNDSLDSEAQQAQMELQIITLPEEFDVNLSQNFYVLSEMEYFQHQN